MSWLTRGWYRDETNDVEVCVQFTVVDEPITRAKPKKRTRLQFTQAMDHCRPIEGFKKKTQCIKNHGDGKANGYGQLIARTVLWEGLHRAVQSIEVRCLNDHVTSHSSTCQVEIDTGKSPDLCNIREINDGKKKDQMGDHHQQRESETNSFSNRRNRWPARSYPWHIAGIISLSWCDLPCTKCSSMQKLETPIYGGNQLSMIHLIVKDQLWDDWVKRWNLVVDTASGETSRSVVMQMTLAEKNVRMGYKSLPIRFLIFQTMYRLHLSKISTVRLWWSPMGSMDALFRSHSKMRFQHRRI